MESRFLLRNRDQRTLAWLLAGGMLCLSIPVFCLQPSSCPVEPEKPASFRFVLDLNKADAVELQQLPGIGARLAGEIVRHRETNGPFEKPESIVHVKGIGPKKRAAIQPYLFHSPQDDTSDNFVSP